MVTLDAIQCLILMTCFACYSLFSASCHFYSAMFTLSVVVPCVSCFVKRISVHINGFIVFPTSLFV